MSETSLECDVLVAGSGAAGMTAALTAAHHGLDVVVAEMQPLLGGTTARNAGSMWLPCSRVAAARGIQDSPDKVRTYLRTMAGDRFDEPRVNAFLDNAPRAIDFLLDHTAVRVYCPIYSPDYHSERAGGIEVGRALYSEPYDGRLLGDYFYKLAPQLPELCFLGIMPQLGVELVHFINAKRSPLSAWYVARRVVRRGYDQLVYGRTTRLTNGAALAGRLVRSALDVGIPMWTSSPVRALTNQDGKVTGAVLDTPTGEATVRARRGVVLACGGFSYDDSFARRSFRQARTDSAIGRRRRRAPSVMAYASANRSGPPSTTTSRTPPPGRRCPCCRSRTEKSSRCCNSGVGACRG